MRKLNFAGRAALSLFNLSGRASMATASVRSRRRPARAVVHRAVTKPSLTAGLARLAFSRPARTAYVALGTAGLAALAVALIGPKRLDRERLNPLPAPPHPHPHT